jgi:hypothetical protein
MDCSFLLTHTIRMIPTISFLIRKHIIPDAPQYYNRSLEFNSSVNSRVCPMENQIPTGARHSSKSCLWSMRRTLVTGTTSSAMRWSQNSTFAVMLESFRDVSTSSPSPWEGDDGRVRLLRSILC